MLALSLFCISPPICHEWDASFMVEGRHRVWRRAAVNFFDGSHGMPSGEKSKGDAQRHVACPCAFLQKAYNVLRKKNVLEDFSWFYV